MKKICVFCGSSTGNKPVYAETARTLGNLLADKGIDLVYGGSNIGIMGILSTAMLDRGMHVTGVIPEYIHKRVEKQERLSKLMVVKDMHERKAAMYDLSDAFVALPGGIGTLEEVMEIFTWQQLRYHGKPVGILNTGGFYDGLITILDHMVGEGFLKTSNRNNLIVEREPETLLEKLRDFSPIHEDKWIR